MTRRSQISWCLYDFGNSAFTTVIVTVAYSVYFTEVVAPLNGVTLWGRAVALSMLIVAVISPLLGTLADRSGRKRAFIGVFTLLASFFTGLLYFVKAGDVTKGILFFVIANISYNAALTFYDAFLKELVPPHQIGRLSGYGWATGYVGGFCSLLLVFPLIKGGFAAESLPLFRLSFVVTAFFFLFFSVPTLIWVRDKPILTPQASLSLIPSLREGFCHLGKTIQQLPRPLVLFFIAYFFYNDAINTIIVYASIFATRTLHFSAFDLVLYFIITQVSAAAGAFLFAPLTDRWGAKKTISVTLVFWVFIVVGAYFVETRTAFYVLGLAAGAMMGPTQAASRALLAHFAPDGAGAEFFGLFALTGKISASLGPLVYGEVARISGSQRVATLSLGLFFLVGLVVLTQVRPPLDKAKENT
jgi:UMF1 family MFS transporter